MQEGTIFMIEISEDINGLIFCISIDVDAVGAKLRKSEEKRRLKLKSKRTEKNSDVVRKIIPKIPMLVQNKSQTDLKWMPEADLKSKVKLKSIK
jgi:hypothetical protein